MVTNGNISVYVADLDDIKANNATNLNAQPAV